jgi:type II secretory pathway pseudopilin PulG
MIELMITVAVIVVLLAIALPGMALVRNSVRSAGALAQVTAVHNAIGIYQGEDPRQRFPPVLADATLVTRLDGTGALGALDLLRECGLEWRMEQVSDGGALLDPWRRALRCPLDVDMDGVADRPAARSDWNARGNEPFAYVHSLGIPRDVADGLPASADRWIYLRSEP